MDFSDPDISNSDKLAALSQDHSLLQDVITIYNIAPISTIENLLYSVVLDPNFSNNEKYPIYDTLVQESQDKNKLEQHLAAYIPELPVFEIQVIKWLLSFNSERYLDRLFKYLSDSRIEDRQRYSQLLEFKEINLSVALRGAYYMHNITCIGKPVQILSSQFFLQHAPKWEHETTSWKKQILSHLFKIAEDEKTEYKIRADAADTLYHYADPELQRQAFKLLEQLGGESRTLYENKQNVHVVDITDSLKFISNITEPLVEYNIIVAEIHKLAERHGKPIQPISSSLGRIMLDTARYGNADQSWNSLEITQRVWAYIQTHSDKDTLEERLLEELEEMAETCSSGHAIRMLNVLSGFGTQLTLSFEDQIVANFNGRMTFLLNNVGTNSSDETMDDREDILIDMADKGPAYMKFFVKYLPQVIDFLRDEFVPNYLKKEDFDLYIQEAITRFESGK